MLTPKKVMQQILHDNNRSTVTLMKVSANPIPTLSSAVIGCSQGCQQCHNVASELAADLAANYDWRFILLKTSALKKTYACGIVKMHKVTRVISWDITHNHNDEQIVDAIISLMYLVAEGQKYMIHIKHITGNIGPLLEVAGFKKYKCYYMLDNYPYTKSYALGLHRDRVAAHLSRGTYTPLLHEGKK